MIEVARPYIGEQEFNSIREVLKSGRLVQGEKVREFEEAFAKYIGTEYAVAVNSGTSALHLSLLALGIGKGDEVIVPALTFFATVEAVLYVGAKPIFCDVDLETYCMSPSDLEKKITEKTKAIIPVHLFGHPCDITSIGMSQLKASLNLPKPEGRFIIEDACQAHGAEYERQKVGSFGTCGCFSFYATKNMTTCEGGMITTDDEELTKKLRLLRSHGMTDRHTHSILGYNYRMNEIQAAMGIEQLLRLDEMNEEREYRSMYLRNRLTDVDWIKIPPVKPYAKHVWFWCPLEVNEEKLDMKTIDLVELLRQKGLQVRYRYTEPLYRQPVIKNLYKRKKNYHCPNAELVAGKIIGLPNHYALSKRDLNKIVGILSAI